MSQTSHCNIKGVSVSEVMRIENMIIQSNSIDILTVSPHNFCKKCMETQRGICNLTPGLKGLMRQALALGVFTGSEFSIFGNFSLVLQGKYGTRKDTCFDIG